MSSVVTEWVVRMVGLGVSSLVVGGGSKGFVVGLKVLAVVVGVEGSR